MNSVLTNVVTARPRLTLLVFVVLGAIAGILGSPVVGMMSGQIVDRSAESVRALDTIAAASGQSADDDVLVLVDLPDTATSPAGAARIASVAKTLAAVPDVASVVTSTTSGNPALDAKDQRASLIIGHFRSGVADPEEVARRVVATFSRDSGVTLGGTQVIGATITDTIGADLANAEMMALPILLLLSILIFRGVIAALVPVALGGLTVVSSMLVLRGAIEITDLTRFVMNLLIGLGAGLSIDYSLLIISRYREEAATHGYGRAAVTIAMRHAGRTICFSATTVAAAMSTLTLFPQLFLRSMGIGGVVVTAVAAGVALLALPAVLVVLGPAIDRWAFQRPRWPFQRRRPATTWDQGPDQGSTGWYRLARWQAKRPTLILAGVLAGMAVLALPTFGVSFQHVDATSLPANAEPNVLERRLAAEFHLVKGFVVTSVRAGRGEETAVADLAGQMTRIPGYVSTAQPSYVGRDTWLITGGTYTSPYERESLETIDGLRSIRTDLTMLVGGQTAAFADLRSSITERLPLALVIVGIVVLVAIFLLTSSVLVPIETLLVNGITVLATLGVLVWVFQDGHFEGALDYTSSGRVDLLQPVLVLIITFGLATDYGVFLLARIREHYELTGDNAEAIAVGLGRTGKVISNAALLMIVAIGAFSTSNLVFVKVLGVGTVTAVALDATIVRAFLVPSAMKLLGRANWWAPGWLRGVHRRLAPAEARLLAALPEPPGPALATGSSSAGVDGGARDRVEGSVKSPGADGARLSLDVRKR